MSLVEKRIRQLGSRDSGKRQAAARALERMGPDAAPAVKSLARALWDPNVWVRAAAARALGQIGPAAASAVEELAGNLSDPQAQLRAAAAHALGQIGPAAAPAVEVLSHSLTDIDQEVRASAAGALGQIGPAAAPAVKSLARALWDADEAVCVQAAQALGQIGPAASSAVQQLARKAICYPQQDTGRSAARALEQLGPVAAPAVRPFARALARTLAEKDPYLCCVSARVLGSIGAAAVPAALGLGDALDSQYSDVREEAANALNRIAAATDPPGRGAVLPLLKRAADAQGLTLTTRKALLDAIETIERSAQLRSAPIPASPPGPAGQSLPRPAAPVDATPDTLPRPAPGAPASSPSPHRKVWFSRLTRRR